MTTTLQQAVAARGSDERSAAAHWRRRSPRLAGGRSKSWPDTTMISLSLRDHRDVNADAQALTDLGSHAFPRSSAGVSACVAAWSLLNHLKGA